jgi:ABC-type multidrug transport system ATPase subunit
VLVLPAATALSVRDLAYWYVAGTPVLDRAALTVAPGEVVMVRGPNGSGKTTLLRLAAGVAAPCRGVVRRAAAVGYQPQTGEEPPPRMSAGTWLAAVTRMRKDTGGTPAQEILGALGGTGTDGDGQYLGTLSRGTITKVLLAGALSGRPGLVLLDEPFAPLDAAARDAAAELIRAAADRGAGVLLSDHHGAGDLVATRRTRIIDHQIAEDAPPARGNQWKIILRAPGAAPRELCVPAGQRDRTLLEALLRGEEVCRVEELP